MSYELAEIETEMASELSAPQMELLLGDERPKIDYSRPEFSYTTERLWRDREDVAKAAIKLLAEPRQVMPYRRIMRRLHMSYHLLRALERESVGKIADTKQSLANLSASVTQAAGEKALELVPTMKNAKDAAVVAGIFGDKFLQFSGEATQRIDLNVTVDIGSKIEKLTEALLASREKRAQVREVETSEDAHLRPAELDYGAARPVRQSRTGAEEGTA